MLQKSQSDNEKLQDQFALEKEQMQSKYDILEKQLADALIDAANEAEEIGEVLLSAKQALEQSQKNIRKLKSQNADARELANAYRKQAKDAKTYKATHKGIYTPEMCTLVLFMAKAGCSHEYIGEVIECVFNTAGMSVKGTMSA